MEYVAMPDGSSSAAPVIMPGPSAFNSDRIHRDGVNARIKESERKLPTKSQYESAVRNPASHAEQIERQSGQI
jgi:hypothetical protein